MSADSIRGKDRTTYSRASRRHMGAEVVRAGWVATNPRLCCIVDASGSMDRAWVSRVASEIQRLTGQFPGARCYLIVHTDRIVWQGWIEKGTSAKLAEGLAYSGGTNCETSYQRAKEIGRWDCLIHFTDCELGGIWPEATTARKLVIGAFGTGATCPYTKPPARAKVIPCTDAS